MEEITTLIDNPSKLCHTTKGKKINAEYWFKIVVINLKKIFQVR